MKNKLPRWLQIARTFVFGAMTCAAVWMISTFAVDIAAAFHAGGWPSATGTVFFASAMPACGKDDSYLPVVRYRYKVGDVVYGAQRIAFGRAKCVSQSRAESIAGQYKVDAGVKVYYNPDSPGESVLLVDDVLWDTWLGAGLALLFFAGSVFLTAQSVRAMRTSGAPPA
jgi:Protein of unknown function (DUF3592)